MTAHLRRWTWPALALLAACGGSSGQSVSVDGKNEFDGTVADVASDVVAGDAAAACDVTAAAAALAGAGAKNCGFAKFPVSMAQLPSVWGPVYGCFIDAVIAGQPAYALFDKPGIDSKLVLALVRRPAGGLGVLLYDDNTFTPPYHIIQWQSCLEPSIAKPGGIPALYCRGEGAWTTVCPTGAAPADEPAPLQQWTPISAKIDIHPAYPPQPTPWTQLKVQKGAGPCPPNATCSWTWTVDANGAVTASPPNAGKQLSPADVQTLWELLGPPSFLTTELTCPPPPTDIGYTMSLYVNDTPTPAWTQDVTGCVIGDAQSMPAQVMKLLQ